MAQNIFDDLNTLVHRIDPPYLFNKDLSRAPGLERWSFDQPIRLEISCETTATRTSQMDPDYPTKALDYIMLTHNLQFSPGPFPKTMFEIMPTMQIDANPPKWKSYTVAVEAATIPAGSQEHEGSWPDTIYPDHTPYAPNNFFHTIYDNAMDSVDPFKTLTDGVSFIRSEPAQTTSLDNYSQSVSYSVSANAGFFGDAPTGGITAGTTVSNSHSWSVPSVSVEDHSTSTRVQKTFHLNTDDAGTTTLQMTMIELVSLQDDGTGARATKLPGAQTFRHFRIAISADLGFNENDDHSWFQTTYIIKVAAPTLPRDYPATST